MTRSTGIIVALPGEARSLGMTRMRVGDYFAIDEVGPVVVSGMGAAAAQRAAARLIARGVTALISWGVVGALDSVLEPGDIVVPETIDTEADDGHQRQFFTSAWQHAALKRLLAARVPVTAGRLWSAHAPVVTVQAKQALARQAMTIVDMEAGAIAAQAAAAHIPLIAIKAVCDPARRTIPAPFLTLLGDDGRIRLRGAAHIAKAGPSAWRAGRDLHRDWARALHGLAKTAEILPALASYTCVHE